LAIRWGNGFDLFKINVLLRLVQVRVPHVEGLVGRQSSLNLEGYLEAEGRKEKN
jgi:hypothetical protein